MKKVYSAVLALLMCFCLQLGAFAADVNLSTVVPAEHEITVTYNEGGYVLYNGELVPSGTTLVVPRHGDLDLEIICGADSHLESVTVNDEDRLADMENGLLAMEDVYTDLNIVFGFEACNPAPVDPDDPDNPDDPENPPHEDPCTRMGLAGGVYVGDRDNPLPSAELSFDFGELEATADDDGHYVLSEIKDGRHIVEITDKDGEIRGRESFVIDVRDGVTEVFVETLEDGTQIVIVPTGTDTALLDFVVNEDGTVTILPCEPEPEPVPPKNPITNITDNPIIIKTGALIREYPVLAAGVFAGAFFLLLFLFVRRRKKDDEDEEQPA